MDKYKMVNLTINILTQIQMKQNKKRFALGIQDPEEKVSSFFDPLNISESQLLKKQVFKRKITQYNCCVALFADEGYHDRNNPDQDESLNTLNQNKQQVDLNVMKSIDTNIDWELPFKLKKTMIKDQEKTKISKIISNIKHTQKQKRLPSLVRNQGDQKFGFNGNGKVSYPQTPGFKSLLQSPFGKFNYLFKDTILTLSIQNQWQTDTKFSFEMIDFNSNPLNFYHKDKRQFEGGKYFMGMALRLRQQNCLSQCLYFFNLACYTEPFSDKTWKNYVSVLQDIGRLREACILAKTAFLLTQSEELIKNFLSNGEKCGYPLGRIQGIMCSVSNPETLERTLLPESAKLQIKLGKQWKGLKVLWQVCKSHDFKLPVCTTVLFLARYLSNMGYHIYAMSLLKGAFAKSMSKLEIYLLYLEMSVRLHQELIESDLQEVLKYLDCISGENRFRLLLQISRLLFQQHDPRYYYFLKFAFDSAVNFCATGTGCSKALKQIYYSTANFIGISPCLKFVWNDHTVFEANRYHFINGKSLIQFQFSDWKYYLHYSVAHNHNALLGASKKWPQTGRVIAEWIHCLRLVKSPLAMLKIWRERVEEVPKSGELWCEGGRIYAELGELANAQKCFRCAIHFTPQYGDSFIQQLRLLLRQARFMQINKLKKLFLVSQPFYGHVLSYIGLNHRRRSSLTFNQIWESARLQICEDLYKEVQLNHIHQNFKLFTAYQPYNLAYTNPCTKQERQRLFTSYEQMQNRN